MVEVQSVDYENVTNELRVDTCWGLGAQVPVQGSQGSAANLCQKPSKSSDAFILIFQYISIFYMLTVHVV
jgi:hypothetical protein